MTIQTYIIDKYLCTDHHMLTCKILSIQNVDLKSSYAYVLGNNRRNSQQVSVENIVHPSLFSTTLTSIDLQYVQVKRADIVTFHF